MSVTLWKTLAIISCTIAGALTFAVLWVGMAFRSNLSAIENGAAVCLAGARSYDSVAAAQMIGRLDLVSFLLTMGGLLVAVFGFVGFWMIRREALDEAAKVAGDTARQVVQDLYGGVNEQRTHDVDKGVKLRQKVARTQARSRARVAKVTTAGAVVDPGEGGSND